MGMRSQKKEIESLLRNRDRAGIPAWAGSVRSPLRVLTSMTYDRDELMRWRAIEATGWVVAARSASDLDRVRDIIRRLFWQMNDESGGLLRHGPELIAEILVNVPILISEYAHMLPPFFREEPFERGAHLAVHRIAQRQPEPFSGSVSELSVATEDSDPVVRAYAALTLGVLGATEGRGSVERLLNDDSELRCYDFDHGKLVSMRVFEAARMALNAIYSADRAA